MIAANERPMSHPNLTLIWDPYEDPMVLAHQLDEALATGELCVVGTPGCDCTPWEENSDG